MTLFTILRTLVHPVSLLAVLVAGFPLLAQTDSASLTGLVTDPSGAVMLNASVTLVNVDTNISQTTLTNQAGIYHFPSLQPGTYRVTIKNPGFQEIVTQGLVLHVQDAVSKNFKMELGSTTESVTVSATGAAVNTEDGSVGAVIERQVVENMPLNGRSFQGLISLSPGVATVGGGTASTGQFVVNGQRSDTRYFSVDGVSGNVAAPFLGSLSSNGP